MGKPDYALKRRSPLASDGFASLLAAVLCILIGLLAGLAILYLIDAEHAMDSGFLLIIKGGWCDYPYGIGKVLSNGAPLIMTGLSVGFAFKTGLFNIGAAGQYTLGAFGALYCAIVLHLPWYASLLAATLLGALWGAIPGLFKAYLNINEVITSIMFNWIGLYLVNEIIYGGGTGVMYDSKSTKTYRLLDNASLENATIPDLGLAELFQNRSTTIAIFIAIVAAVLVYVVLSRTTFGYELKACGHNKNRRSGRHGRRAVLPVRRGRVESPAVHRPARHRLQRHPGGSAGLQQPHRHHLLRPVCLPHHHRRHLSAHPLFHQGNRRCDHRHHHLPVRLLPAVPGRHPLLLHPPGAGRRCSGFFGGSGNAA